MSLEDLFGYAIVGLLTIQMALFAYKGKAYLSYYREINWRLQVAGILVLIGVLGIYLGLMQLNPDIAGISWLKLLGSSGTNVGMVPIKYAFIGVLFAALFLLALPYLAFIEERLFREGTPSWGSGFKRSLAFGLFHMLVGVPLGAAFGLSLLGLYLTYCYFQGGIEYSARAHFQYNLTLAVLLLIGAAIYTLS